MPEAIHPRSTNTLSSPHGPSGTLLVFAHRDEAQAFRDVPHLVTGVGKVNGAVGLSHAIASGSSDARISRVVVLGTAGVVSDGPDAPSLDTVVQIVAAVQHDFSLPSPTLDVADEVLLPSDETVVIATGDTFVTDDAERVRLAGLGAHLVDMETYAYVEVCRRFEIPLQVFKVPSDFADSSTTDQEWDDVVAEKSRQLRVFWDARLFA